MKVAISIQDNHLDAAVDELFGRCPYFAVVETNTSEVTFVPNEAMDDKGAGIKAARILLRYNIEAVITGNIGPKAFEVLSKAGLSVYKDLSGTIQQSLELLAQGKLKRLTAPNN